MADLSNFKRDQTVDAHMAGAGVSKLTAFKKEGKTFSQKQNSGRKRKLTDRNRRTFTRIVLKDH